MSNLIAMGKEKKGEGKNPSRRKKWAGPESRSVEGVSLASMMRVVASRGGRMFSACCGRGGGGRGSAGKGKKGEANSVREKPSIFFYAERKKWFESS